MSTQPTCWGILTENCCSDQSEGGGIVRHGNLSQHEPNGPILIEGGMITLRDEDEVGRECCDMTYERTECEDTTFMIYAIRGDGDTGDNITAAPATWDYYVESTASTMYNNIAWAYPSGSNECTPEVDAGYNSAPTSGLDPTPWGITPAGDGKLYQLQGYEGSALGSGDTWSATFSELENAMPKEGPGNVFGCEEGNWSACTKWATHVSVEITRCVFGYNGLSLDDTSVIHQDSKFSTYPNQGDSDADVQVCGDDECPPEIYEYRVAKRNIAQCPSTSESTTWIDDLSFGTTGTASVYSSVVSHQQGDVRYWNCSKYTVLSVTVMPSSTPVSDPIPAWWSAMSPFGNATDTEPVLPTYDLTWVGNLANVTQMWAYCENSWQDGSGFSIGSCCGCHTQCVGETGDEDCLLHPGGTSPDECWVNTSGETICEPPPVATTNDPHVRTFFNKKYDM